MTAFCDGPELRWGAWHGDDTVRIPVGERWQVDVASCGNAPVITDDEILDIVTGAASTHLADIDASMSIAIGVDDLARPTPAYRFVPVLVKHLFSRGVRAEQIAVIAATGAHRPLTRRDFVKKLGETLVSTVMTCNHHPYENLVDLGESARGTPIRINADFARADLRVVCGCVMPHPYMGFGGGAKMLLPGLSGIESLEANHTSVLRGLTGGLLTLDGNEARADVEEVAAKVGVDLALQAVVDTSRELVGLYGGDVIGAHRAAASKASEIYRVSATLKADYDIIFLGAYPKDGEQYQLGNAFNALKTARRELLRPGGTLVIVARCSEGLGVHGLQGRGMRLHRPPVRRAMMEEGREIVVFSPGLTQPGLRASFHDGAILVRTQQELRGALSQRHGDNARALVVPCAPLAILEADAHA